MSALRSALEDVEGHRAQLLLLLPAVMSHPQQCQALCASLAESERLPTLVEKLLSLCTTTPTSQSRASVRLPSIAAKVCTTDVGCDRTCAKRLTQPA